MSTFNVYDSSTFIGTTQHIVTLQSPINDYLEFIKINFDVIECQQYTIVYSVALTLTWT